MANYGINRPDKNSYGIIQLEQNPGHFIQYQAFSEVGNRVIVQCIVDGEQKLKRLPAWLVLAF